MVVKSTGTGPDSERIEYWDLVKKTLEQVFHIRDAARLADSLQKELEHRSDQEKLLFYHAEPLDVAGGLAGVPQINPHQVRQYHDLAHQWNTLRQASQP